MDRLRYGFAAQKDTYSSFVLTHNLFQRGESMVESAHSLGDAKVRSPLGGKSPFSDSLEMSLKAKRAPYKIENRNNLVAKSNREELLLLHKTVCGFV